MQAINEEVITPHTGWIGNIEKGQILRITGRSVLDFIAFKSGDTREYFDTARTRIYNLNMFPTKGHRIFSKQNNPMMGTSTNILLIVFRKKAKPFSL